MRKQKQKIWMLMLSAILAVPFSLGNVWAMAEEPSSMVYEASEDLREQVNFNSGWKFYLGDVEDGQALDLDDSAWTDVALPHNFSVPYDMDSSFYVGYGWYRKDFVLSSVEEKKVALEFEGVFQVAEVYVNGQEVGVHEGGYTGFEYDITDYLVEGNNQIAIRVNNIWQPDLSPRAGDHQFTGGIYRDVYLNITNDVHVTWYGTFVTTPDLNNPGFDPSAENIDFASYTDEDRIMENIEKRQSNVRVQTEIENDSNHDKTVWVKHQVVDAEDEIVCEFISEKQVIASGALGNLDAVSEQMKNIHLWDTENPYLYKIYTTVFSDDIAVDSYTSTFGFRWAQYKNDGFYLNGEKTLLNGANVHQDHGGWADAVTNAGFYRDVAMIKECGMNFIRGSHYPHDPSFADACDELGILFWSESVFWGMGGCAGKDEPAVYSSADWFKDAYPQNPADEKKFEDSCLQALTDMIRINRNHPSIVNWSMGNEVFFTADETQQKAKNLVNKMRNLAHLLDPTRKAGMGGVQRQGYDSLDICDIAGYNGDGGKITNTWMPNIVAEYGSKTADRPGELRPFYDQIAVSGTKDKYQLTNNSAGLSLWCAFHHGTIGGAGLAKMGMIDYYRLPLQSWYWYRQEYTHVPAEQSIDGTAAGMELTASQTTMTNDGTEDTQIILTMLDEDGNWVNTTRKVTLEVVSGPGVFPTGKEYTFVPNKTIRDGKAAIEFRSYYSGETVIRASASNLPPAEIRIYTVDVTGIKGEEPEHFYEMPKETDHTDKITEPVLYGAANVASGRPSFPSSNNEDRALAADGDNGTSWIADIAGSGQYWMCDLEFVQYLYKLKFAFDKEPYPFKVEVSMDKDANEWILVNEYTKDTVKDREYEESLNGIEARYVKITFTDVPEKEYAYLTECEVYGTTASIAPKYEAEWTYLSDMKEVSISTDWGIAGKDVSCEENTISIGGVTYKKGLGLHANSTAIYNLEGKYTRLRAYAGIDDEVGTDIGDAIFQIYADDRLIYEKNLCTGDSDMIDLSVSGVSQLKLVTLQNGSDSNDHTDWADAKVLGAIRETTVKDSGFKSAFTSNTQKLHPGEAFKTEIHLENTNSEEHGYVASLTLYDETGSLIDMKFVSDYLAKEKTAVIPLEIDIPADCLKGSLHINVWKRDTLEPISKTIHISAGEPSENLPSETLEWKIVDGEEMDKSGNWSIWNSSSAYKTSETYTGTSDTPLTEDTSISFTFKGAAFRIAAKVDQSQTGAKVYLDNVLVGEISTASVQEINVYKVVYESNLLTNEEHQVKIVPIGKFGLDYLEYAVTATENDSAASKNPTYPGKALEQFHQFIEMEDVTDYTLSSRKAVSDAVLDTAYGYSSHKAEEEEYKKLEETLLQAITDLEKEQEAPPANPFIDVVESEYYYNPVIWAVEHGITSGLSETMFGTGKLCTREQIVTFLWNYAGRPEAKQTSCTFKDVNPEHYYYRAMLWAVENGITNGLNAVTFGVGQACTREQIVTFLWNYAGKDSAVSTTCSFTDVNVNHYYYKAMLWAVENKVVAGYSETVFGVGDACTREQIVTFLYRYDNI